MAVYRNNQRKDTFDEDSNEEIDSQEEQNNDRRMNMPSNPIEVCLSQ